MGTKNKLNKPREAVPIEPEEGPCGVCGGECWHEEWCDSSDIEPKEGPCAICGDIY